MKRFDSAAVKARLLERLRMSEDWAMMLSDGTIGNILDSISEGENELARYLEYLYLEKKWKTAQNFSSLEAQGDLLSYKRQLPQSAIGYVIVSHTDHAQNGQNRLANYGKYFFDINAKSDYDDITINPNASLSEKKSLVPWTYPVPYTVPKGTRFISNKGVEFISTQTVTSRSLLKPYSQIAGNAKEKTDFFKSGGWNGIKYLKVPVIQGKVKKATIGRTTSRRFETFTTGFTNIDAAVNNISEDYFRVNLIKEGQSESWVEIDSIQRANAFDKVFEKKILKNGTGIALKFGDGISGKLPPKDAVVEIEYLETLGSKGNVFSKYSIQKMVFPSGANPEDPRNPGVTSDFLSCTNISSIQGGKDMESLEEYKVNAPKSYLRSYTTSVVDEYVEMIKKYSPLNLLHVKAYPSNTTTAVQINSTPGFTSDKVYNYMDIVSNNLNLTTVLSNGEVLDEDEAEHSLLGPLTLSLNGQVSQNDTFTYVKPNIIEIAPSVKVRSSDLSITENEICKIIKTAFSMEYDIFNQDFKEPLYYSKLIEMAKVFPFSDSVSILNEAVASILYDNIEVINKEGKSGTSANQSDYILKIPFSFDPLFYSSQNLRGFKDCTVNSDYLIKVDLKLINSKISDRDRTFFLYDNRNSSSTKVEDGKKKEGGEIPLPYENHYENVEVRVAQFPFISGITDSSLMSRAKNPSVAPYEIRPYVQGTDGTNKVFDTSLVADPSLRVSFSNMEGQDNLGSSCYKKDLRWIDDVDISFENTIEDMSGTFEVPLDYLKLKDLNMELLSSDEEVFYESLVSLLKQYVSVRVYAQPKMTDFEPQNENDIVCLKEEYVKVEKDVKYV